MFGSGFSQAAMFPKLWTYKMIYKDEIKLVNWGGVDVKCRQIILGYDNANQEIFGILLTKDATARTLEKGVGTFKSGLYIKATTPDKGTWELTLPATTLKQISTESIWFHHHGIEPFRIISKPQSRRR